MVAHLSNIVWKWHALFIIRFCCVCLGFLGCVAVVLHTMIRYMDIVTWLMFVYAIGRTAHSMGLVRCANILEMIWLWLVKCTNFHWDWSSVPTLVVMK